MARNWAWAVGFFIYLQPDKAPVPRISGSWGAKRAEEAYGNPASFVFM